MGPSTGFRHRVINPSPTAAQPHACGWLRCPICPGPFGPFRPRAAPPPCVRAQRPPSLASSRCAALDLSSTFVWYGLGCAHCLRGGGGGGGGGRSLALALALLEIALGLLREGEQRGVVVVVVVAAAVAAVAAAPMRNSDRALNGLVLLLHWHMYNICGWRGRERERVCVCVRERERESRCFVSFWFFFPLPSPLARSRDLSIPLEMQSALACFAWLSADL